VGVEQYQEAKALGLDERTANWCGAAQDIAAVCRKARDYELDHADARLGPSLRLSRIISRAQSPLLLLVRLYWAGNSCRWDGESLHNLGHVTQFFTTPGNSRTGADGVVCQLCGVSCGLLLILGLGSRLTGLVLTVDMLVAYVTADREALLSVFNDPGKFYRADPYTFLFASVLVLICGPGWFALDTWIARRCSTQEPVQERPPHPLPRDAA
jgi:putative oxidoreductase